MEAESEQLGSNFFKDKASAQSLNDAKTIWRLVEHIQSKKKFLNHDLRGIIGRGVSWAKLLPYSLKKNPQEPQQSFQEILNILTHIQNCLESTLQSLDLKTQETNHLVKVAWLTAPSSKGLKAFAHQEWIMFSEVPVDQILKSNYRPDYIEIQEKYVTDEIKNKLNNFEFLGTEIHILKQ